MATNIKFDINHNPEYPTLILAKKGGDRLGVLKYTDIRAIKSLTDAPQMSFAVNKYLNGELNNLWSEVKDFRLIWWKEENTLFEMTVQTDETDETVKSVTCNGLAHAELSQINVYGLHINNEDDPNWNQTSEDDYVWSVLYDSNNPSASILNRVLENAPHYTIAHVDSTIASIQRSFDFDGTDIMSAFNDIGEEVGCLFIVKAEINSSGQLVRNVYVYDLQDYCNDCNERTDNLSGVCPNCGSINITKGYGNDTTIFVTADELGEKIGYSTNADQVKNCFKLKTGDDLMTATVRNCNPNGSDYIWYYNNIIKEDMSAALVSKLEDYIDLYDGYKDTHIYTLDSSAVATYNSMVNDYKTYNPDLQNITATIVGYPALMETYYDIIDFGWYVSTSMLPTVIPPEESTSQQAGLLTYANINPVAINSDISTCTKPTAESAILDMAKAFCDTARFKVTINNSAFTNNTTYCTWTGNFKVENYSDDTDYTYSTSITVTVYGNDHYATYVQRKIDKVMQRSNAKDLAVSGLYSKDTTLTTFQNELHKYGIEGLTRILEAGRKAMDVLDSMSTGDRITWTTTDPNSPYTQIYEPYAAKVAAVGNELDSRERNYEAICGRYDNDTLVEKGMMQLIEDEVDATHESLDLETYLGNTLWLEFCSYRRDDEYSNDNYISDGLSNPDLFKNAMEFLKAANNELYKSSELQHSITSTLRNLLYLPKFEPLLDSFEVGNWIRVQIDDEIYKLRLIEYDMDFDNFNNISVKFSDVMKIKDGITDVQDVLSEAKSMSSSYSSVSRQASKGNETNKRVQSWIDDGLKLTNNKIIGGADNQSQTWDEHGMLFKEYDSVTDSYLPTQMRIINSTIAITDDNWESVKTAVGYFYYVDPADGQTKNAYGINGEVIIGKMILGQNLGIYNGDNSLKFDNDGFDVENGHNRVLINPSDTQLFKIQQNTASSGDPVWNDVLYFDSSGNGHFNGAVTSSSATITGGSLYLSSNANNVFSVRAGYQSDPDNYACISVDEYGDYNTRRIKMINYIASDQFYGIDITNDILIRSQHLPSGSGVWDVMAGMDVYYDQILLFGNRGIFAENTLYDENGGVVVGSDLNIKNTISYLNISDSADFVYSLKPSQFKYNAGTSNRFHHGFIAQDVKQSMGNDDWGVYVQSQQTEGGASFLGLRYDEFIADIVGTLQYQKQQIEELQQAVGIQGV